MNQAEVNNNANILLAIFTSFTSNQFDCGLNCFKLVACNLKCFSSEVAFPILAGSSYSSTKKKLKGYYKHNITSMLLKRKAAERAMSHNSGCTWRQRKGPFCWEIIIMFQVEYIMFIFYMANKWRGCLTVKDLVSIIHQLIVRTDAQHIYQHLCDCRPTNSQSQHIKMTFSWKQLDISESFLLSLCFLKQIELSSLWASGWMYIWQRYLSPPQMAVTRWRHPWNLAASKDEGSS